MPEPEPPMQYPAELPIARKRDQILPVLRAHPVVVVCGETGSGKSTQLPKMLLELGCRRVDHTQPRRLAARTLATRVAEEMGVPLGREVGYAVRFNDRTSEATRIRYVTDGLLLQELQRNRDLRGIDGLIIDEAHERSLNIDFLLGYLKRLLPRRPDLKLIITSATIDPERFAAHFADAQGRHAPIVEVSGRTYPVEVRYRPPGEPDEDGAAPSEPSEAELDAALCDALDEVTADTNGDVLVFMPTERHIREAAELFRGHLQRRGRSAPVDVLPLYARLSPTEQQRVFKPSDGRRRVVLATNVAESSVTVPGVTAVIDTGTARISRFSPRSRVQRLPIEAISRASADQRAGRCGRVAPGICVRLYSEASYEARDAFTAPEILRTHLAAVILRMEAMRLGDVADFPFIEPPTPAAVREGQTTLRELQAADRDGRLTQVGRSLSRLPVDPRVGRMVLAGRARGVLREVLVVASALEGQDPRVRPPDKQSAADQAHAAFRDPDSDFATLLKLWDTLHEKKAALSNAAFRRWTSRQFLSYPRVREWFDLHRQLADTVKRLPKGRQPEAEAASVEGPPRRRTRRKATPAGPHEPLHRALLTGLISNVAHRDDEGVYRSVGGTKLRLWPGSALAKKRDTATSPTPGPRGRPKPLAGPPRWIMAAETVSTSREFARTAARVEPAWIEDAAGDLVRRTYSEPHWDAEAGQVMAFERTTLGGLTLAARRRVKYAHVDPAGARQIFIQQALVEADTSWRSDFLEHNLGMQKAIEQRQARLRRGDLLNPPSARFDFYDRRLPPEVYGIAELRRFLKTLPDREHSLLRMAEADLLAEGVDAAADDPGRPPAVDVEGLRVPVVYRHAPGEADDGATLEIPLHVLNRLDAARVDWGLPGQLEERLTALIRGLPKDLRKVFAPAPASAKEAAARIDFGVGRFEDAVADALGHIAGRKLDATAFRPALLPDELRLNIRVMPSTEDAPGSAGTVPDPNSSDRPQSRELPKLRQRLAGRTREAVAELDDIRWARRGLRDWPKDVPELPPVVEVDAGGVPLRCYPALVPDAGEADRVDLRLIEQASEAEALHGRGVLRLAVNRLRGRIRNVVRHQHGADRLALEASPLMPAGRLFNDLADAAIERVLRPVIHAHPPRTREAFEAAASNASADLSLAVTALFDSTCRIVAAAAALQVELDRWNRPPPGWEAALRQSREQLEDLVRPGFVGRTPDDRLPKLPRYLEASSLRLRKLDEGKAGRDAPLAEAFERRLAPLRELLRHPGFKPGEEVIRYRWMLEEWRVALFAESLGTGEPVSEKRLEKQARKADREVRGG